MTQEVPEGFDELPEGLGFTDVLRPLYRQREGDPTIAMFVQERHTNMMGICHGGVLMTLADVSAATALHHGRGTIGGSPTLNLSFDFVSAARAGDWLEARVDRVTVKRRFGFSSGVVLRGDTVVLRFSGGFYFPDHEGLEAKPEILDKLRRR